MSLTDLQIFQPAFFIPEYRSMQSGAWELRQTENVLCQGYWSKAQLVPSIWALLRDSNVWMSITPMELESQAIGIEQAKGHVTIFGLGMGWAAAATALRDQVTLVTVVEYDTEVIALHHELDIFSQLAAEAQSKIRIEQGDAYTWRPTSHVDLLMPDIWLPLVSDGRVAEVQRMQTNVGATSVYFWGQELEIARHCRAAGRSLDDAGIAATTAAFALPLIGPAIPDYAQRIVTVAERWMGNRWLSEVA
jgi:hypothetical protein